MNEFAIGAQAPPSERPSPYVDRRALSEAWYDALYRRRPGHEDPSSGARPIRPLAARATSSAPSPSAARMTIDARTGDAPTAASHHAVRRASDASPPVSDAISLARVSRARLRHAAPARAAGQPVPPGTLHFAVPQADGSLVRLVVTQAAAGVDVVAVCSPSARPRVERSLHSLREKLAASCIPLSYKVHER